MPRRETRYGFEYGKAFVTAVHLCDSEAAWIDIHTPKGTLQVKITPTGFIRHWLVKDGGAGHGRMTEECKDDKIFRVEESEHVGTD